MMLVSYLDVKYADSFLDAVRRAMATSRVWRFEKDYCLGNGRFVYARYVGRRFTGMGLSFCIARFAARPRQVIAILRAVDWGTRVCFSDRQRPEKLIASLLAAASRDLRHSSIRLAYVDGMPSAQS